MAMGLRAASPVVVGRQGELGALLQALEAAMDSGSASALVGGEAGVGKTRLIHEFGGVAERHGARVCIGRCLKFGDAIWPLAPLGEILAGLSDKLDDATLDLVIGNARGVLARLAGDVGDSSQGDTIVSSEQLCQLLVGMFGRLAERRPLVLVVEDLHWADDTTRLLFSALARAHRVRPLLLIGTFRTDELHRRHPLRPMLAEVERERCERIELARLDRAATVELIGAIHGSAVDARYVDMIHRRSDGNPYFIEELVAAQRSGIVGLPVTLRDVILARAAVLDDAAVQVLSVTAAAGSAISDVLADVSGLDPDVLRTKLGELFATALLVSDGDGVRFRHDLGREVFYDELLPDDRVGLHARLAASLQARRPERLGEIARHWSAANDTPRAFAASVAAGRQTLRRGAAAEALAHLTRALELWEVVDATTLVDLDHPALLLEAAVAAEHARHLDRAIDLARKAATELASVDPMREGQALLLLRDLYRFTSRWDECADAVARALAVIPDVPPSNARAYALAAASLGHGYANRHQEALTHARQSVAVAEAVGDPEALIDSYNALGNALYIVGDYEGGFAVASRGLELCEAPVSPERVLTAYICIDNGLARLGRYNDRPAYAQRGVALARSSGLGGPRSAWIAGVWISSLVLVGRWTEAERVVGEVADLLDHPTQAGDLAVTWGVALIRQGRLDDARPVIEQARAVLFDSRWDQGRGILAAVIVEFDAADGRCADARDLVTACLGQDMNCSVNDVYLVSVGIAVLADSAQPGVTEGGHQVMAEHAAVAARWIERIDAQRDGRPLDPWQSIEREHAAAQLERLHGRSDPLQWKRLVVAWAGLGLRYEEAMGRLRRAEALLAGEAGRASTARRAAASELAAAGAIAADLHAAPLLTKIEDLARRARLPLGSTSPPDPVAGQVSGDNEFGLTPREFDVLALLAGGRSNGQIGKELFISTKTASTHVSNIIRKLGVTNRVEAATIAVRHHRSAP
jgi:DNA-binding CsgD family transcriptional regulator/tetratricopeptide (TPR) repeat protein